MADTRIELPWKPFLPHQGKLFDFEPARSRLSIEALLGGWGSGKTSGVMRKAFKVACMNPWTEAYGNRNPLGIIISPTAKTMRDATLPALMAAIPRQAIKKIRQAPESSILLSNGFKFLLYSAEAEMEGVTACLVVIDEVGHQAIAGKPSRFMNLMARIRDPESQRMAMLVAGLPESGWVRDTFDQQGPDRITILAGMADNPLLPKEAIQAYLENCPGGGEEEAKVRGQWMPPQHAVYPQYDAKLHLTNDDGHPTQHVHIGVDIGNFGAMLIAQEVSFQHRNVVGQTSQQHGLHIVDEILTHNESVEQMCYRLRTETSWNVRPGVSTFCVDPTTRREETAAIRKHFPGVRIVKRDRGDEHYPIESGIRVTQTALKDALGNTRLRFTRRLASTRHGIIDGLQRYRRNAVTQLPIKDNLRDHVLDSIRYLCCTHIQTTKARTRVI